MLNIVKQIVESGYRKKSQIRLPKMNPGSERILKSD